MELGQRQRRQAAEQAPRQLILFPSPFQGHITPMLQLATLLSSRGFSITVVHPRLNSPDHSAYPTLRFEPIDDGLSAEQDVDFMQLTTALNKNCEAPFRECVARLLSEDSSSLIVGLIDDGMPFVEAVSKDFKLPRILFIINSVAAVAGYLTFPFLGERGYFPIQDLKSEAPIPEVPPLRIKDLPIIGADDPEVWFQYVSSAVKRLMTLSSAIFWNSFESLEQASLVKFKQSFQKPVFAIGPLHKYPTSSSSSLLVQDRSCMAWLDQQPPNSVIYVSFGSLATIEKADLDEAAWGLANSKQPFLWAVRRGAVRGSDMVDLPEGFEEEIQGRGVVANWVPQVEVLAHPAVAGFWTHCGWNSTLESICEGVPMLCWPSFGDQKVNARYISHVWKVGLQLECGPERGDVEKAIRRLMVEKEGEELRERARALKEDAEGCLKEGGSSYQSLKGMVDYIITL